ncbi:MAG: calcineurin-like phosphoesterase family protein [Deltaproteobacteria bacterium]|nr:calcineurin-like phosphoesterase family protein [Deltaproteobacteria bacterium]
MSRTTPSRSIIATALWALVLGCAGTPIAPEAGFATGVVFHDRNGNGKRDRFDFGIRGVALSNGREVVRSDAGGRYRLPVADDFTLFVVKPSGWTVATDANNLPRFYYRHKPAGSPANSHFPGVAPTGPRPASIDFPLTRHREPKTFDVVLFGDTQPYWISEVDTLSHDIIEELIGVDAAFGITLGDVVGDDLSLFEPLNRAVGLIGIPWYNVPGNHDLNYDANDDANSDETFERVYGPGSYAFEYGRAHFIVLDDVVYGGYLETGNTTQNYVGGLSEDQLAFVRGYLAGVPRNHLVVVAMHIPLAGPAPTLEVPQRRELFAALASHPYSFSIASHMHTQSHEFFGPEDGHHGPSPHHHLIQGTTSGSWWLGTSDEVGIPHATMRDGTPNGYSILRIDGNAYTLRYQVARRPADYQMNIFAPDAVSAEAAARTEVLVNVFAGSDRSRVEMRLGADGAWIPLTRVDRPDPYFLELKRREADAADRPARPLPPADPSRHLWRATLPADPEAGTSLLEVRTIDMFGATHRGRRILRIERSEHRSREAGPRE